GEGAACRLPDCRSGAPGGKISQMSYTPRGNHAMPGPSCTGPLRRREFLRLGTLALGGLGLADLLAARAAAARPAPDPPVVLLWMWGGPSHFETYDPKPDAPAEIRGPFRPIPTAVPGLDLCELFPLQAKIADKVALVRSLHHAMSAHNDGSIEVL